MVVHRAAQGWHPTTTSPTTSRISIWRRTSRRAAAWRTLATTAMLKRMAMASATRTRLCWRCLAPSATTPKTTPGHTPPCTLPCDCGSTAAWRRGPRHTQSWRRFSSCSLNAASLKHSTATGPTRRLPRCRGAPRASDAGPGFRSASAMETTQSAGSRARSTPMHAPTTTRRQQRQLPSPRRPPRRRPPAHQPAHHATTDPRARPTARWGPCFLPTHTATHRLWVPVAHLSRRALRRRRRRPRPARLLPSQTVVDARPAAGAAATRRRRWRRRPPQPPHPPSRAVRRRAHLAPSRLAARCHPYW